MGSPRFLFSRMLRSVVAAALIGYGSGHSSLEAQTVPAWRYQPHADVQVFEVGGTGAVLAFSDSGLVALSPGDGHVLWNRPRATGFWPLGHSDLVLVATPDDASAIELESGQARWSFDKFPPLTSTGGTSVVQRNLVLLTGMNASGGVTVLAVSLDSGVVRWRQDSLFSRVPDLARKGKDIQLRAGQPILLDSDTTMVIFPTRGGVMRIHTGSGRLIWRNESLSDEKPLPVQQGYAPMIAAGGQVLVPYDKKLIALRSADGSVLWHHLENFPGAPAQIVPTARGLLVRGYHRHTHPSEHLRAFVDLLDPSDGRSVWPKPLRDLNDASAMLVRGDTAYVASRGKLFTIDIASGALSESARFKFKGGGDTPWIIEAQDSELLLVSNQNLVCLAAGGQPRYELYYSAPGASLLAKVLSSALIIGLHTAAGQVAQSNGYQYYPIGVSNPVLDARYHATVTAARYVHMLTGGADSTGQKGFSVVRLDKVTGKENGRVWVNDRSPEYVLDPASGTVYLLRDKRELVALRF
jgi:outer membrane protein assembly factor BamB